MPEKSTHQLTQSFSQNRSIALPFSLSLLLFTVLPPFNNPPTKKTILHVGQRQQNFLRYFLPLLFPFPFCFLSSPTFFLLPIYFIRQKTAASAGRKIRGGKKRESRGMQTLEEHKTRYESAVLSLRFCPLYKLCSMV